MASLNCLVYTQKIITLLTASLLVLSGAAYADGKKMVKWVDSNGITHYGDKLPHKRLDVTIQK